MLQKPSVGQPLWLPKGMTKRTEVSKKETVGTSTVKRGKQADQIFSKIKFVTTPTESSHHKIKTPTQNLDKDSSKRHALVRDVPTSKYPQKQSENKQDNHLERGQTHQQSQDRKNPMKISAAPLSRFVPERRLNANPGFPRGPLLNAAQQSKKLQGMPSQEKIKKTGSFMRLRTESGLEDRSKNSKSSVKTSLLQRTNNNIHVEKFNTKQGEELGKDNFFSLKQPSRQENSASRINSLISKKRQRTIICKEELEVVEKTNRPPIRKLSQISSTILAISHREENVRPSIKLINSGGNGFNKNYQDRAVKENSDEGHYYKFVHQSYTNTLEQGMVDFMLENEHSYRIDSDYIKKSQPYLKWQMRGILIDWMSEVSSDYLFKRETFHLAVGTVDRFLQKQSNIEKSKFQLVGLASLFLVSKMEEVYTPKIENVVTAANNAYSDSEITSMEREILKVLDYGIIHPTMNSWAGWFMLCWDQFVELRNEDIGGCLIGAPQKPKFKLPEEESYQLFRKCYLAIDVILLDIKSLEHLPRVLVASVFYILLGMRMNFYTTEQVIREFPCSSLYLLDESSQMNQIFKLFLNRYLDLELMELLPTVQYVSTFFLMPFVVDLPVAMKIDRKQVLKGHFEEFLAYQTHTPTSLKFVLQQRQRNIA